MENCIFCNIVNKTEPAIILYEDGELLALINKYPAAETHYLVIPKKHIHSIAQATVEDAPLIGKMILLAQKIAKDQGIEHFKLAFNAGKYASLPHLHLHFLAGDLEAYKDDPLMQT